MMNFLDENLNFDINMHHAAMIPAGAGGWRTE
jgi:hypothetical protein